MNKYWITCEILISVITIICVSSSKALCRKLLSSIKKPAYIHLPYSPHISLETRGKCESDPTAPHVGTCPENPSLRDVTEGLPEETSGELSWPARRSEWATAFAYMSWRVYCILWRSVTTHCGTKSFIMKARGRNRDYLSFAVRFYFCILYWSIHNMEKIAIKSKMVWKKNISCLKRNKNWDPS